MQIINMTSKWFYLHHAHLHTPPLEFVHSLENSWFREFQSVNEMLPQSF